MGINNNYYTEKSGPGGSPGAAEFLFAYLVHFPTILIADVNEFLGIHAPEVRNKLRRVSYKARVVPGTAMGHRRHIGAIGL